MGRLTNHKDSKKYDITGSDTPNVRNRGKCWTNTCGCNSCGKHVQKRTLAQKDRKSKEVAERG
jgi:hypothetical protein